MPKYCKAYKLEDLRKFSGWSAAATTAEKEMEDNDLAYVMESLKVTKNCLDLDNEEDFLLNDVSNEWEAFCKEDLKFEVPDWEAESERVRQHLKELEEKEGKES
ncbi:MAG: hypothetical protein QNK37_01975 [Acidobacteriota bacterium]|nr:hypothetical protein [Acidobacteriota bacterium]